MAAQDRRELCGICKERYNEDVRQPVALQCGHSFCRPCVVNQHDTRPPVRCPNCRHIHDGQPPPALPTNYLLLNCLRNISSQRGESRNNEELRNNEEENLKKDKRTCKDEDSSDSDSEDEELKKEKEPKDKEKKHVPEQENQPEDEKDKLIIDVALQESNIWTKMCLIKKVHFQIAICVVVTFVGILGGVFTRYYISPAILDSWGFTETGLRKHSYATRLMSETHVKNNNTVPEDSWLPWLQQAGQKGFDTPTSVCAFIVGFFVFMILSWAVVKASCYWRRKKLATDSSSDVQKLEVPLTQKTNSPTS